MKANFKLSKNIKYDENTIDNEINSNSKKDITKEEFEEFIIKSGASGSFMVFRSDKKDDELGLDEL